MSLRNLIKAVPASRLLLKNATRAASTVTIDSRVFEISNISPKMEHATDYLDFVNNFVHAGAHQEEMPPGKPLAAWMVDQGGKFEYVFMWQYDNHKQRNDYFEKMLSSPGYPFLVSKIGKMIHNHKTRTLRLVPGVEFKPPNKPSMYEIMNFGWRNQDPEVMIPAVQKGVEMYGTKMKDFDAGIVGAFFSEFGSQGELMILAHWPDFDTRMKSAEAELADENLMKLYNEQFLPNIRGTANFGMRPIKNLELETVLK